MSDAEQNDEDRLKAEGAAQAALRGGWRTTEFWIALALKLLGAWLISKGKDELGAVLIVTGGGGYLASRGYVKGEAVRRVGAIMLVCMLGFGAMGCSTSTLRADAIGPALTDVLDRHDAYLAADPFKDPLEKSIGQRDSDLLRALLKEAGYPPAVEEPQCPEDYGCLPVLLVEEADDCGVPCRCLAPFMECNAPACKGTCCDDPATEKKEPCEKVDSLPHRLKVPR